MHVLRGPARPARPGRATPLDQIGSPRRRTRCASYATGRRSRRRRPRATKPCFDQTDPAAYEWGEVRRAVAAAHARGWPVLLTVSGPVPKWATKRSATTSPPEPGEFPRVHDGGRAALRRPRSRTWSIWNEPNHPDFLRPQYDKRQRRSRRRSTAGSSSPASAVCARPAAATTRPVRRDGAARHRHVVSPLAFLRGALCLERVPTSATASAQARRSTATRTTPTRRAQGPFFAPPDRDDVTIGVLGRLITRAGPRGAARARSAQACRIYLTEFGIQSDAGPDPASRSRSRPSTARSPSGSPTPTRACGRSRST